MFKFDDSISTACEMKLVSNSITTYFLFDAMFHYYWIFFKGIEFDIRGALDKNQISVAYISSKDCLLCAIRLFIYVHGETPVTMEYYMFNQLKRLICDNELYTKIERLHYSCAENDEDALNEIEQIKHICYTRLIHDDLLDLIGRENDFSYNNFIACIYKIRDIYNEIEEKRLYLPELIYSNEVAQLIRETWFQVTKGK